MIIGNEIEIRIVVRGDGALAISGPDLVAARPVWDYVLAEIAREIAARTQELRGRRIISPVGNGDLSV